MNEPIITLVGNLAADPELRVTPSGVVVCKLRMAQTPRDKKGDSWEDGYPFWQDVTCWRELGEHAAETFKRGDRVIVTGRLKMREYEKDGQKRTAIDLEADAIGPDLRYATAKISKVSRSDGESRPVAKKAAPSAETSRQQQADDAPPW